MSMIRRDGPENQYVTSRDNDSFKNESFNFGFSNGRFVGGGANTNSEITEIYRVGDGKDTQMFQTNLFMTKKDNEMDSILQHIKW